jgi:argininosuccinate synthase
MQNLLVQQCHCSRKYWRWNDQIRFDLIFQTIAPEIEIITLSRFEIIKTGRRIIYQKLFLGKHNILSTKDFGEQVLEEKKP